MPLLRGTDGELKMSKSYDNYIGITEPPEEQYGKTMSIPDELLEEWYRLATPLRDERLDTALRLVREDPYRAKRELAFSIVETYHGVEAARAAAEHFDRVFRQRDVPESIPETEVPLGDPALRYDPARGVWVPGLVARVGLAASNSEAIRLVEQGAVAIDGQRVDGRGACLPARPGDEVVVRRGKRHFVRVRFTGA
jgi:tyrosyl-tRNA synthetase